MPGGRLMRRYAKHCGTGPSCYRGPHEREVPDEYRNVLHWVSKASRPLVRSGRTRYGRAVLDSLKLKFDGTAAAAETVRRKRRTLVNAVNYAVDLGEFRENPIHRVRWQKPKVSSEVDPRVVANPEQARNLLLAVFLRRRLPARPWSSPRGAVRGYVFRWSSAC